MLADVVIQEDAEFYKVKKQTVYASLLDVSTQETFKDDDGVCI